MKPQRIAVVGNLAGVGYFITAALRSRGIDADLYITAKDSIQDIQNPYVRHGIAQQEWIKVFRTRPALRAFLEGRKTFKSYDLVIALTLSPAYVQFFNKNIIAVATGTDMREFAFGSGVYARLLRRAYRKARHVFCMNMDLIEPAERLGLKDKSSFMSLVIGTEQAPEPLPSNRTGKLSFFMPARWHPIKGLEAFVDACAILIREGKDFVITIVNYAPSEGQDPGSVATVQHIEAFIREHAANIEVIEPISSREELAARYAAADIVVNQFILGVVSLVDLEAMQLGRPILNYFNEAFATYYDGDSPPFLNARTSEEIAALLRDLMAAPDVRKQLDERGHAGWAWMNRHHSLEALADQLVRTIDVL